MDQLPADFAEMLAGVLEPGHEKQIAEIIEAATRLEDDSLQIFLEKFAARIRVSPDPVKPQELMQFLRASKSGDHSTST